MERRHFKIFYLWFFFLVYIRDMSKDYQNNIWCDLYRQYFLFLLLFCSRSQEIVISVTHSTYERKSFKIGLIPVIWFWNLVNIYFTQICYTYCQIWLTNNCKSIFSNVKSNFMGQNLVIFWLLRVFTFYGRKWARIGKDFFTYKGNSCNTDVFHAILN